MSAGGCGPPSPGGQGWWGAISFFFNFFVLGANANAARRLRALGDPSLSGELVTDAPRGFAGVDRSPEPDAAAGGYTHFDCQLAFDDGTGEEALVHLLPNDELLFTSTAGS